MRVRDYIYVPDKNWNEISDERKKELINRVEKNLKEKSVNLFTILLIGKNNTEYNFLFKWLEDNNIEIRGSNLNLIGKIPNYQYTPRKKKEEFQTTLSKSEQDNLFKKLKMLEKDSAEYIETRNKLIENNMKIAYSISFMDFKDEVIDISREDRFIMASFGLINAVLKYDLSKQTPFNVYAKRAIIRRIITCMYEEDGEIKLHKNLPNGLKKINNLNKKMNEKLGRDANKYEIADYLELSLEKVETLEILEGLIRKYSLESILEENNKKENEEIIDNYFLGRR